MINNLIVLSNLITIGNMMTVVTLVCAGVYGYYKIRRYIAKQHIEFLQYLNTLTEAQTRHIEECIHKLPSHPETVKNFQGTRKKVLAKLFKTGSN